MPARPLSNGLSAWVKPCARQVFLRHVSAVDENTATARQLSPSPQTHASSCQETVVTPDVASIMELPKGSLASLEKRLLGKKDPRSAGEPGAARRAEPAVDPPALSERWVEARPAAAQVSVRAPAGHARRPDLRAGEPPEAASSPDVGSERAAAARTLDVAGARARPDPGDGLRARLLRSPSFHRMTAGGRSRRAAAEQPCRGPDTCSVHCG